MKREKPGRRDARGARSSERTTPAKRESKPFKRYADASKSEEGWTKPDGKPMRKRVGNKDDAPKSFDRERPSRSRNFDAGEKRARPSREIGAGRRKDDGFKPRGSREDKPFRKSDDDFKPRRSSSTRGDDSDFKPRGSREDKPFRKSDDDFKPRRSSAGTRGDDADFKPRGSREDKPFRKSDDFKPRRSSSTRGSDSDFKPRGSREDKPFRKSDDDFKPRRSSATRGGDDDFKPRGRRDDKPFRKSDDDFKPRRSSATRGVEDDFNSRSDDDKPKRFAVPSDDFKSKRESYDSERRTDDFKSRGKKERPARGKSFLKSSVPDDVPFKRFEKDFSRNEKRTDKFKLKARPASRSRSESTREEKTTSADGTIRLNRYIANAGICSRREADDYISAGLVSVNGEIVSELGIKVLPTDDVRYNGERLKPEKNVYVLLNKPKDYITTSDDPDGRKTVMELIAKACKERVYPVGRLDRNTTGVLLFTNDGDLAKKLTHPSSNIRKVYHVELDKTLKKNDMQKMLDGMELEDGPSAVDDISYDSGGDKSQVGVELHSGKNRIVRRMFESLGYEVRKLDRVVFAGLTKKDLPRGRWRLLSEAEVGILKMQVGKGSRKTGKDDKSQLKLF